MLAIFSDLISLFVCTQVGSSVSSSWSVWEDQWWRGGRPVLTRFFYAWKYRCQLLDSRDLDRHAREQRRQVRFNSILIRFNPIKSDIMRHI